jgi:tRNA threonylcarbamoyladenosine biosynthesis protein TsaB
MAETWLLIETSGRVGRVGLARGDAVVRSAELDASRRHARDLAAVVGAIFDAEGLRPADLTGVMVGIGPGSYTGLRVGVMSAKAFAYATGCRLVPVPTFAAVVLQSPTDARHVWVIADALQGQIYLQRFTRLSESAPWTAADELRIERADESLNWAAPDAWMTGPGVKVFADSHIPQCNNLVPEADREPSVESLFRAGRVIPPASREGLFALEPLYLRGSSAEEKAKQAGPRG